MFTATTERNEHPFDRVVRLGQLIAVTNYSERGLDGFLYKAPRRGHLYFMPNPYTELYQCELCGKLGTPRKVYYRNDCWAWDWDQRAKDSYYSTKKGLLCMGCWNRVRAIRKRERDAIETTRAIQLLTKELRHERKQANSHDRATT